MYTLIIEDRSGNIADEISFDQGSYTIGRVEGNDIILPSNAVSRTHARIYVAQGRCYINDLGSANGVIVDGEQISQRHELRNASQIRIGDYTLYLEHAQRGAGEGNDVLRTHIVANDQNTFKLVRVGDMFAGEEFSLTEQINSVGRTDDNFILLSDPSISRNHSQIINEGMVYRLVDLGSSNGTRVNGKPVRTPVALRSGDEIEFGNLRFVFAPGNQRVDLAAYAQRRASRGSGMTIAIVAVVLVLVIVGGAFVAVKFLRNDEATTTNNTRAAETTTPAAPQPPEIDPQALFNAAADAANKQDWDSARELLARILAADPEFPGANDLQSRVITEANNQGLLDEGDKRFQEQKFAEAKVLFEQISQSSTYYVRAQKKIEQVNQTLSTRAFLEGKKACDAEIEAACIKRVCEAIKLNSSDQRPRDYLTGLKANKAIKKTPELIAQIDSCL